MIQAVHKGKRVQLPLSFIRPFSLKIFSLKERGNEIQDFFMCLFLFFVIVPSYQNPFGEEISTEEAKAFVENVLKIYNDGNLAMIEECYSLDCIIHNPSFPETVVGYEAFKNSVRSNRVGFPDAKLTA